MRLLIMGPPGAGKGTQAALIADHFGIPAISTGAIFRSNVARQTDLGRQIKTLMESGNYVPDEITEQIVAARLDEPDAVGGWLLDGFPRTLHQVQALDRILAASHHRLDAVISLEVDDEALVHRLLTRAEIEGRLDDNEQTIRHRMRVYREDTAPLLATYAERGLLLSIDGDGDIDEVTGRVAKSLERVPAN